jgi:iron(II)-dependent oxidoreductase
MIHFVESLREARWRTLALVADLNDEQLIGPRLEIVNPLLWEIGHVAWFQEYWVLRHLNGRAPILPEGDALYDSAKVAHATRWDIPLLSRTKVLAYMQDVLNRVSDRYDAAEELDADAAHFLSLVLFHEDMHDEAFGYTRQTLGYPQPQFERDNNDSHERTAFGDLGDALIPAGRFLLGSLPDRFFIFDNEMDAHEVQLEPFSISRTAASNPEFAAFVAEGGYERRKFWSDAGWQWRKRADARQPVYWQRDGNKWLRRNFDQLVPLEDHLPVLHVNWFEADAFCRWAQRRLPTEAEWETAASAEPTADGQEISQSKRRFPWGDEPSDPNRANLDWKAGGCIDVRALPAGDNAFGCRQMIGNVWEWTASDFTPYPGFVAGPYKEYSAPWFGDHKVLRGGCWATRSRLIHNAYRNFYQPHRRDVWAGFRTCAL